MQPHGNHHQVRGPAVHVAKQFAKGNVVLEIQNVAKRLDFAGMVIEHQKYAGEGQHNEQVEGNSTHAPGVAVTNSIAVDLGGMEMEEDVREHSEGSIPRRVIVL